MQNLHYHIFFLFSFFSFSTLSLPWNRYQDQDKQFNQAMNYEGSSNLINLEYHMGPVLAISPINIYIIWYGHWNPTHKSTIKDFIHSLSSPSPSPSVSDWWRTVRLYNDQTGSNITADISLSGEFSDSGYSQGIYLTRLAMQSIIKTAVSPGRYTSSPRTSSSSAPLPLNPHNGLYLILTSAEVQVQDFCRAVCGFHYFTFPNIVGVTVPYAWVGYSGKQCPGMCAYPFAWPNNNDGDNNGKIMGAPNGDVGIDGMISVMGHEMAEVTSNPLVNAWYAGDDPIAPTEIADLCMGVYGSGGGGGYVGQVFKDSWGNGYNLNGTKGRKFLVQWVWNPVQRRCFGPNAID